MGRYEELKNKIDKNQYFKVVCGAGNEDPEEVRKLALIYTLAGTTAIDVSANVEVVKSAVKGINKAMQLSSRLGRKIKLRPFITVSVGLKGDPHVQKAIINSLKCESCGNCLKVCPQKAITNDFNVKEFRCIGCEKCLNVCNTEAISFYHKKIDFNKILPKCIKYGAETLELHAITLNDKEVFNDWKIIDSLIPNNFISMCIDRNFLSNQHLIKRINKAKEITGERLVIQADGVPMSGGNDDHNTTLQAIAIADIIRKNKISTAIIASGGTNSKTRELAELCGVTINGIAIGTHARKILSKYIEKKNFENDLDLIKKAVTIAEKLIKANVG